MKSVRSFAVLGAILLAAQGISAFTLLPKRALSESMPTTTESSHRTIHNSNCQKSGGPVLLVSRQPFDENPIEAPDSPSPSVLVKLVSSPVGAFLVLAGVILVHECGHYAIAKSLAVTVDEFSVGIGPKLAGGTFFGDPFSLRALPIGGYVSLNQASLAALPLGSQIEIISAGVGMNVMLSFMIYARQMLHGHGISVPVFDAGILVSGLTQGAAAQGMLSPGDVIQSVNGKRLLLEPTSSEMQVQRAIRKLIDTVQATPEGQAAVFDVLNPNTSKVRTVTIKPKQPEDGGSGASLGVLLVPNLVGVDSRKVDNPVDATALAANKILTLTSETAIGLWTLAGDFLSGQAGSSEYRLSGPLGVIKRASQVVKTQDLDTVLNYVAAISINLAVLNCIPIPPSDGFQIIFACARAALLPQ
jgi:regulator of sigma E protease